MYDRNALNIGSPSIGVFPIIVNENDEFLYIAPILTAVLISDARAFPR
jgi:hypothetical protein